MIKITTDSTCDLPRELLERYNITVTPLGIIKAGKLYQDGVDIRTGDIAAHVDAGGEITTTNAVNVADYEELFRRLMEEYDAVIHLNIGMGFSSCHQNARLAAEEVDGVYVVDSANLTVGHGMLVLAAAEAAEAGKSVTEILAMLEEMIPRVETSFVLDRLDYMKKGGRCSTATALGASLLKLHPCLDVVDGKLPVTKKYRGSIEKVVEEYVRDRLRDRTDLDTRRAFLVDTCPDDHLASIAREVLRQDGRFQEIIEAKAGCTIFCHCGPGTFTAKKLGTCPKAIDAPEPRKILLPREGVEDLGARKVVWSDLDGNGHVYSGNYGDFVWDYLPADLQEKVPREFFINYSKEATLGQELRMVGCRKGGEYLMEGLGPEGVCFSAQCVF